MKVFVSHKKEDELIAAKIALYLNMADIESYLDILDDQIIEDGKKLTNHIIDKISSCTDVIVVLSEKTIFSWWVPFEIGVAVEKKIPLVNYLSDNIKMPGYLEYWPRLRSLDDIKKYISVRNTFESVRINEIWQNRSQVQKIDVFYSSLKNELNK